MHYKKYFCGKNSDIYLTDNIDLHNSSAIYRTSCALYISWYVLLAKSNHTIYMIYWEVDCVHMKIFCTFYTITITIFLHQYIIFDKLVNICHAPILFHKMSMWIFFLSFSFLRWRLFIKPTWHVYFLSFLLYDKMRGN